MSVETESYNAALELLEKAKVEKGGIIVVGCSTSEVCGGIIGKASSPETAEQIWNGIKAAAEEYGVYVAAQCCEHLNRAIVVEREAVNLQLKCGIYEEANVVPQPKAGGSFATMAYKSAKSPAVLEHIKADCGIDIGGTLIGMHLKDVAVPVRLEHNKIGDAYVIAARTRKKYIGGERAKYEV